MCPLTALGDRWSFQTTVDRPLWEVERRIYNGFERTSGAQGFGVSLAHS